MHEAKPAWAARLATPDSAYSWVVALATLVLASLSFGAVTTVPILFRPMAEEFSWSSSLLSSVHMSAMFGAGVGSLVIGRIVDQRGFLAVALAGALATGGGLWIASRSASAVELYVAYALLVGGIGQGAFFSPLAAAASLWFDRYRSLALAVALSGQSVGGLLVPPLLRGAAEAYGWRSALQAYAGVTCVSLLACALPFAPRAPALAAAADSPPGVAASGAPRGGTAGASPRVGDHGPGTWPIVRLGLAVGCSNIATFAFIGHLVAYGETIGMAATQAAWILASLLGVTLVSRLSAGWLLDRRAVFPTLVAMSMLHAGGTIAMCVSASSVSIAASVLVVGLGFGGYLPAYGALVRSLYPAHEAGRRLSELYLSGFFGAGIGTWGAGVLRDLSDGYALAFRVAALFAVVAIAILLRGRAPAPYDRR